VTPLTPLDPWIGRLIREERPSLPRTRAALTDYQLERVRELVDFVREYSPFYRRLLNGFSGGDLHCLGDWESLPFTTSRDLQADSLQFLCVSRGAIDRVVSLPPASPGEAPKRLHFTRGELEQTVDFFQHGMSTLVGVDDRVGILLSGDTPDSVGDLLNRGLRRLGVESLVYGPVSDPVQTAAVIREGRLNCLVGIPHQILSLSRLARGDVPGWPISKVLLCSDYAPAALVLELEWTWNCTVLSHYGLTETAYLGGVECLARRGYHLCEADLLVEVVDPETGQVQPPGEVGEIVVTTLTRRALPLIRYRTGDRSRLIPGRCPCGSILKRLDRVDRIALG
jgi:phenylacetate-CoA ligase